MNALELRSLLRRLWYHRMLLQHRQSKLCSYNDIYQRHERWHNRATEIDGWANLFG